MKEAFCHSVPTGNRNVSEVPGKKQPNLWREESGLTVKARTPLYIWNDRAWTWLIGDLSYSVTLGPRILWKWKDKNSCLSRVREACLNPDLVTSIGVSQSSICKRRWCCWLFLFHLPVLRSRSLACSMRHPGKDMLALSTWASSFQGGTTKNRARLTLSFQSLKHISQEHQLRAKG